MDNNLANQYSNLGKYYNSVGSMGNTPKASPSATTRRKEYSLQSIIAALTGMFGKK